jgi:hypothetical protein
VTKHNSVRQRLKPLSIFGYSWERRFHPLEEAGYHASRGAVSRTEKVIGLSMLALGFYLRRHQKHSKLYSYTAKPGETVRIRVMRGTEPLADATIGP